MRLLGLLLALSLISCQDATKVNIKMYNSDNELISRVEVEVVTFHLRQTPGIEKPKKQKVFY